MTVTAFEALACPLDGEPLQRHASRWACAAGHSFDIARQGYTHMLPVQQKRSRNPGDSKQMVEARRRFLEAGFYQPVAAAVSEWVLSDSPSATTINCLDAGCGEGYYLRQLAASDSGERTLALMGLDISKRAVLTAAKQDRRPNWVVGSNACLPVQSGSLDRVLCIFGFPVYAEFARVLRPNGRLLQVDPGPDHLRELREIIYPQLKSAGAAGAQIPDGFHALSMKTIKYSVELTGREQIADLLAMTPHLYRAGAGGREKAAALNTLSVTVDVRLTSLGR